VIVSRVKKFLNWVQGTMRILLRIRAADLPNDLLIEGVVVAIHIRAG
jgi:hypothetical protein